MLGKRLILLLNTDNGSSHVTLSRPNSLVDGPVYLVPNTPLAGVAVALTLLCLGLDTGLTLLTAVSCLQASNLCLWVKLVSCITDTRKSICFCWVVLGMVSAVLLSPLFGRLSDKSGPDVFSL